MNWKFGGGMYVWDYGVGREKGRGKDRGIFGLRRRRDVVWNML